LRTHRGPESISDSSGFQDLRAGSENEDLGENVPIPLIVGITSDRNDGGTIKPLLEDLARIQRDATYPSMIIWVLVLENPENHIQHLNRLDCHKGKNHILKFLSNLIQQ
jgi:hypothetical protein